MKSNIASAASPLWSRLQTSAHTSKYMMLLHDAEPDDLLLIQMLAANKLYTKSPKGEEISVPLSFIQTGGFIAEETNQFYHDFVFPPLIKDGVVNIEETELAKTPGPSALNPLNSKFSAMFDSFRGRDKMNSVRSALNNDYKRKIEEICKTNKRTEATEDDQFWVAGEMMPTNEAIINSRDDIVRHIERKGDSPLLIVARPFIELAYEFKLQPDEQKLHQTLRKYNAAILQYSGFNFREKITYLCHKDKEMLDIRSNNSLSQTEKSKRLDARKDAFAQFYHSCAKSIIIVELYPIYNGLGFAQPQQSQDYMMTHQGDSLNVLKSYICDFNTGFVIRLNDYIPRFLRSQSRVDESKVCIEKFEALQEKAKELEKMTTPDLKELEIFIKTVNDLEVFAVLVIEDEKQDKLKGLFCDSTEERRLIEEHAETRKRRVEKQFHIYKGVALSRLTAIGMADPSLMLVLLGDPSMTSRLFPVIPNGFVHDHMTYKRADEGNHKIFGSFIMKREDLEGDNSEKSDVVNNNRAIDSALDKLILKTISSFPSNHSLDDQVTL